jgi:hypothetical protein
MVTPIDFEVPGGLLRGDKLRNWLRTDGAGLFSAFPSGVEALNYARELGLAIRTQDFYTVRSEVLSVVETIQPLLNYPDNQLIPIKRHSTTHKLDLSTEFQYRIHLFGSDEDTGILKDQWMTVASARQLTKNEVREVARSYVGEGGASGEIRDYRFAEISAMRR